MRKNGALPATSFALYWNGTVEDGAPIRTELRRRRTRRILCHCLPVVTQLREIGWHGNGVGANGDGQTDVPANLTDVVAVNAGWLSSYALRSDGTVAAWGYDGNGEVSGASSLSNAVAIQGGEMVALAIELSGDLPAGLSISREGEITGTPTEVGHYAFTIGVADEKGSVAYKRFDLKLRRRRIGEILAKSPQVMSWRSAIGDECIQRGGVEPEQRTMSYAWTGWGFGGERCG